MLHLPGYAPLIRSMGGILRFPYGLEISFYFWPYRALDWYPVLGKKGGTYGAIERWYSSTATLRAPSATRRCWLPTRRAASSST